MQELLQRLREARDAATEAIRLGRLKDALWLAVQANLSIIYPWFPGWSSWQATQAECDEAVTVQLETDPDAVMGWVSEMIQILEVEG